MLLHHDKCLIESIIIPNGQKIKYEFKIKGDGIAITADICFTLYNVIITNTTDRITTLTGFINIIFQSNSIQINAIKESLLNPNMIAGNYSSSSSDNSYDENNYVPTFPNVISWNNMCTMCAEQQNDTTSSATTESNVNDDKKSGDKKEVALDQDKPNKRVKIQVNDHLKNDHDKKKH